MVLILLYIAVISAYVIELVFSSLMTTSSRKIFVVVHQTENQLIPSLCSVWRRLVYYVASYCASFVHSESAPTN